jgi:hypothetical protein
MKTRAEAEGTVELAMDWLAQLHDDRGTEPQREADDRPVVAASPRAITSSGRAEMSARYEMSARGQMSARAQMSERAPIGDELRIPIAWCEMGSCISRYEDPVALGEADIRARAIAAGWRIDALRRLACPKCQQSDPWFRTVHPVALWDRDRAVIMAALMAAALREGANFDGSAGAETGVIPAIPPEIGPSPARGRHRAGTGRSGPAAEQQDAPELQDAPGQPPAFARPRPRRRPGQGRHGFIWTTDHGGAQPWQQSDHVTAMGS